MPFASHRLAKPLVFEVPAVVSLAATRHEQRWKHTFICRNSSSIRWFSFSRPAFGGIIPFSKARTTLITPATPLAPSKCPTEDFTDPLLYGLAPGFEIDI